MSQRLIIRTDASIKDGDGVAYAYVATAYHEDGVAEKYEDSQYVDKQIKTTEAERRAIIYAAVEMYKVFKNVSGEFDLLIENDCEGALRRIKDDIEGDIEEKVMNYVAGQFNGFKTRWISSDTMGRPHAMANEARRRGAEEQQ